MDKLKPLLPLFLTASLLIGANSLHNSLISMRAEFEGITTGVIGFISSAYYLGFALGCLQVTAILQRSGHIRAFAAFAAIAAATTILQVMFIDPWVWMALRLINGYGLAVMFTVIESWINARVDNSIRARTLSIYRYIDLSSATLFQYFIVLGVAGFQPFGIVAIALALSLVPIALFDKSSPAPPEQVKFNLLAVFRISPLASIGCIVVGMSNTVFRALGPNYTHGLGFSLSESATFISVGIIGGVLLQYPLGALSDRRDRRLGILLAAAGGALSGYFLGFAAGSDVWFNMIGILAFGAFSMPLYSLCSAHANDRAGPGQHAMISAGVLFFWGFGASLGPLVAGQLMDFFGTKMLFLYTAIIQTLFVAYTVIRMVKRPVSF